MSKDQWELQLKKGVYELAILLLIRDKAMYGYELTSKLNEIPLFSIANGSIYPILKRMGNNNWIASFWHESAEGPRRKYYQITDEGKQIIEQRMNSYKEFYHALALLYKGGKR